MSTRRRTPSFRPATPRSRRLGRELRRLRDGLGLSLADTGRLLGCSGSRLSRIECGEIRVRPGDVMELLRAYGVALDGEPARALLALADGRDGAGWWERLDALSGRYASFIAHESEAARLRTFAPLLVPDLLQTEVYAREVEGAGREAAPDAIAQRVGALLRRQEVLARRPVPLELHAIVSEAALRVQVGGPEVLRDQLRHLAAAAGRPNITVRVLRFSAGAPLGTGGGFVLLDFATDDPPLGYVETRGGELLREPARDIERLDAAHAHLEALALPPAESVGFIREAAAASTLTAA